MHSLEVKNPASGRRKLKTFRGIHIYLVAESLAIDIRRKAGYERSCAMLRRRTVVRLPTLRFCISRLTRAAAVC